MMAKKKRIKEKEEKAEKEKTTSFFAKPKQFIKSLFKR